MKNDFQSFEVHGSGKKSKGKAFNNVCSQPLWNINLSQICPPYLHILLGVTQKHLHLLESFCHELDISIARDLAKRDFEADKTTKFRNYVSQLQTLKQLWTKEKKKQMKLSSIDGKTPMAEFKMAEEKAKTQLAVMQKKMEKLKKKCRLTERAGPVASSLEKVLKKHKIEVVA